MASLPVPQVTARTSRELGFDEVEAIVASYCVTPFGQDALADTRFPGTRDALEARLAESMEAKELARLSVAPDFAGVSDLRPMIDHIEKDGVLGAADLITVGRTLEAMTRIKDLVTSRADELERLYRLIEPLTEERVLARRIRGAFDEHGRLTDEASPTLKELRDRVRNLREDAKGMLEDLVRVYDERGLLQERNFTVRHDRYVLPVKSEFQGRVEGIVHDASQTGQTVFMEPRELMGIGNRITIAQAAVKEEEQRVLVELTREVGERSAQILEDLYRTGDLEAAYARGALAARIDGKAPEIELDLEGEALNLLDARHPLLAYYRSEAERRGQRASPIIPNDVAFARRPALVISGPNAGGKTVVLKTAGLVALMFRAGLPVPVAVESRIPLYAAVLATIGDEQSIADDLSTFSGHLTALAEIRSEAMAHRPRGPCLCLLDELCAGTDPTQGAVLAQAYLEDLVELGSTVVATTHFERLKTLALLDEEKPRFRNASVELDPLSGRPTFVLRLDSAGTSNALDAARRHGMPSEIVERAEALLDPTGREVQSLLEKLSRQNAELEARREALEAERRRVEEQNKKLTERLREVSDEAERLRRKGANAFLGELKDARQKVAEAIEAAKRGADAKTLNALSHALKAEEEAVERRAREPRAEPLAALAKVAPGDRVSVVDMPGVVFDVLEVNGDEVVLARGILKTRRNRDALRAATAEPEKPSQKGERGAPPPPAPHGEEPKTSDNTLDLRGSRVEEGLELLEAFLDRLLKDGRNRAYVVHGHGTGAMKRAVRELARTSRYVARFFPADKEDGGDACTVMELSDKARP